MNGRRPYVDPRLRTRSYIESKLIEIMELCWEHERKKRIDIFSVVKLLHDVQSQVMDFGEDALTRAMFKNKRTNNKERQQQIH